MKTRIISIRTTRYSEVFRRLLAEYSEGTAAEVDGRAYPASAFPDLVQHWCTNKQICATRDFVLRQDGVRIFGFHDHPEEMWAAETEIAFVRQLARERLLRFRCDPLVTTGFRARVYSLMEGRPEFGGERYQRILAVSVRDAWLYRWGEQVCLIALLGVFISAGCVVVTTLEDYTDGAFRGWMHYVYLLLLLIVPFGLLFLAGAWVHRRIARWYR